MERKLLTATELATQLGLDRTTVHRRIVAGEITPDYVAGRYCLFTPETVARLVSEAQPAEVAS